MSSPRAGLPELISNLNRGDVSQVTSSSCSCFPQAGIGLGPVSQSINTSTGRMVYMGKVMNRAARVAGFATSSQVRLKESVAPLGWGYGQSGAAACATCAAEEAPLSHMTRRHQGFAPPIHACYFHQLNVESPLSSYRHSGYLYQCGMGGEPGGPCFSRPSRRGLQPRTPVTEGHLREGPPYALCPGPGRGGGGQRESIRHVVDGGRRPGPACQCRWGSVECLG